MILVAPLEALAQLESLEVSPRQHALDVMIVGTVRLRVIHDVLVDALAEFLDEAFLPLDRDRDQQPQDRGNDEREQQDRHQVIGGVLDHQVDQADDGFIHDGFFFSSRPNLMITRCEP